MPNPSKYNGTTALPDAPISRPLPWFEKLCAQLVPCHENIILYEELFKVYLGIVKAELEYDESWTEEEIPEEMALANRYHRFCRRMGTRYLMLGLQKSTTTPTGYRAILKPETPDDGRSPEPQQTNLNQLPQRKSPRLKQNLVPREMKSPRPKFVKPIGPFQILDCGQGIGCFALQNFKKNEVVCEFTGQLISVTEAESRQKEPGKSVAIVYFEGEQKDFCLDLNRDESGLIYEDNENLARFINHKLHNPNCEIARYSESNELYVRTRRGVAAGFQLFINHEEI